MHHEYGRLTLATAGLLYNHESMNCGDGSRVAEVKVKRQSEVLAVKGGQKILQRSYQMGTKRVQYLSFIL